MSGGPERDGDEHLDGGAAASEGVSPFASSVKAGRIELEEPVPSTEIDLRQPDFLPPPPIPAPKVALAPPTPLGRLGSTAFDQEATLQSTNEEAAALRAALDVHLAKIAAERAAAETPKPSRAEIERQIRELEAKLDRMSDQEGGVAKPPRPLPPPPRPAPSRPASDVHATDYVKQRWGRAALRTRAEEVDEFGHDPAVEARYVKAIDFLYDVYFRVATTGAENIPSEGRCLVVANHSGGPLPYDGLMLRAAIRREFEKTAALSPGPADASWRELRWLAEDFIYYLPFVGSMMNRLGAVRACQENAERLLAKDGLVAVFPEGAKGIGKLYKERYRLQRFGRGGFIRLALRTRTPLVPCAVVGAEEANPLFYRVEGLAKSLGVPYLPITPTFPALGPLGLLPAPTKWKIEFGAPISFDAHEPEAAEDDLLVGRLAEQVRGTIQAMVDRSVSGRRSIWFG